MKLFEEGSKVDYRLHMGWVTGTVLRQERDVLVIQGPSGKEERRKLFNVRGYYPGPTIQKHWTIPRKK